MALLVTLLPLVTRADAPATLGPGWARLGPVSPRPPDILAVDPTWPEGRVLLAANQPLTSQPDPLYSYVLRSRDGGDHWEILPGPGVGISDLQLAAGSAGVGPVFLIDGDRLYGGQRGLYRSTDLGTSWQTVMQLDPSRGTTLVLSPTFATDQLALLLSGGIAYRSQDGGQTFTPLDPATGASVRQIAFSPAYVQDRRVFVVTDDVGDTDAGWQGVLASDDGGDTWSALGSDGLQSPDGEPTPGALHLVISPTLPRDGTLFLVAEADDALRGLFRSQDGGSSWELVSGGQRIGYGRMSFELALSPTFADDQFAVLAQNYTGGSPASHNCRLLTTTDAGSTWLSGPRPGTYEGCADLSVDRAGGRLVATVWKSYGFLVSLDADATWTGRLGIATDDPARDQPLRYSRPRTTGPSGTFFVPTATGVMAIGNGVRPTTGEVACESPVGGFGRLWQSDTSIHTSLGCPLEPERAVRIREHVERGHREEWTEDDQLYWFDLLDSHGVLLNTKTLSSFSPDRVLDGATQRFEGGAMLWLPEPDGQRSIVVVDRGTSEWREFPD